MKTILFNLFFLFLFVSINAQSLQTTPVARINGDQISMIVGKEVIINSVKSKDSKVTEVFDILVEKEHDFCYLLFKTKKGTQTFSWAIQLNPLEPGSLMLGPNGTTHTCTGYCCESCTFTRNPAGEITGCWCGRAAESIQCQTEARCDHTVSSGSGVVLD